MNLGYVDTPLETSSCSSIPEEANTDNPNINGDHGLWGIWGSINRIVNTMATCVCITNKYSPDFEDLEVVKNPAKTINNRQAAPSTPITPETNTTTKSG